MESMHSGDIVSRRRARNAIEFGLFYAHSGSFVGVLRKSIVRWDPRERRALRPIVALRFFSH